VRFAAVLVAALALAAPAAAADPPTLADLEDELICPTCETSLEMSSSPIAERMRVFIRERIAAGDSKEEIKASLVDQFGEGVLAAPPKKGFNLLAWLLPLVGLVLAVAVVTVLARRWHAARSDEQDEPAPRLDAALERRLDDELARFDG
jgi:cytochrome c-type biogenesis protein CcmH